MEPVCVYRNETGGTRDDPLQTGVFIYKLWWIHRSKRIADKVLQVYPSQGIHTPGLDTSYLDGVHAGVAHLRSHCAGWNIYLRPARDNDSRPGIRLEISFDRELKFKGVYESFDSALISIFVGSRIPSTLRCVTLRSRVVKKKKERRERERKEMLILRAGSIDTKFQWRDTLILWRYQGRVCRF